MIKIFKNYAAVFTLPLTTVPSSLEFVVPTTGSFSVTGSFATVAGGVEVSLSSTATASFPTGSAQCYAIIDGIPTYVSEVEIDTLSFTKSHARTTLEALEAMMEGRASKEQMEVQVAGRMVRYLSLTEIIAAISQYRQLLAQEDSANSIARGNSFSGTIRTRWGH